MTARTHDPSAEYALYDRMARSLIDQSWVVVDDFLPPDLTTDLRTEIQALAATGSLRPAGIGRGDTFGVHPEVRSDAIAWLDEASLTPPQRLAWAHLARLQKGLNRRLFLGLESFETHLTAYAPGAAYAKHLDRFRDSSLRTVSFIIYLNEAWTPNHGGALRLFDRDHPDRTASDVEPIGGRLACFLSSEIWHEVLPTAVPRYSLTGWYSRPA
jgi:SM-20-related protein